MTYSILVAPNAFKGSLSAGEAASIIQNGIRNSSLNAEVTQLPVADGGDGTLDVLVQATGGKTVSIEVQDPLQRSITAEYGILGDGNTAVVEMARASGLSLLGEDERRPLETTTYGTGQLMRDAIENGCDTIIVGIGGSATVDGGTGMARALGYQFLDESGSNVPQGGGNLQRIREIQRGSFAQNLKEVEITCACDVTNPLTGERGAANVYAPQKGASPDEVNTLEQNLKHLEQLLPDQLDVDVQDVEGGGAAGGLGAGLYAFCDARMKPGVELVFEHINLEKHLETHDLVISGEGELDQSSLEGKASVEVARRAKTSQTPCLLICGTVQISSPRNLVKARSAGITSWFSTRSDAMSINECMGHAETLLENTTERVFETIAVLQ